MVGAEQIFLQIWSLLTVGNEIFRVFPTQYFNILALPDNEDEYYQLQFNVTMKIENIFEILGLLIVRKGIWPCPPCHDTSQRLRLVFSC
jgi:hypothetical protein